MRPSTNRSYERLGDFRTEFDHILNRFRPSDWTGDSAWSPLANLSETEKAYELSVDLPGLTPADMEIEFRNGNLWISGKRRPYDNENSRTWHRVESRYGRFRRVFSFGDAVEPEGIDAQYRDGVLHITVPKSESARTRHIRIRS